MGSFKIEVLGSTLARRVLSLSLSLSRSVFCELPVLTDRIAVLPQQPCPISFLKLEEIGCFHRFIRKLVCVHQGLMFFIVSLCPSGVYLCMCVCVLTGFRNLGFVFLHATQTVAF